MTHIDSADLVLFGAQQTQLLNTEIERAEFDLFAKEIAADIQTFDFYFRKCRSANGRSGPRAGW